MLSAPACTVSPINVTPPAEKTYQHGELSDGIHPVRMRERCYHTHRRAVVRGAEFLNPCAPNLL